MSRPFYSSPSLQPQPSRTSSLRPQTTHSDFQTVSIPPSPSPPPSDRDWRQRSGANSGSEDEPSLPLHRNTGARGGMSAVSNGGVQVHDDIGMSRRRGGAPLPVGGESNGQDGEDYDAKEAKLAQYGAQADGTGPRTLTGRAGAYDFAKGKQGALRGQADKWARMIPERRQPQTWVEIVREYQDLIPLLIYTALSMYTRLWNIGLNNSVVWDEAHFGKFGAYYINRTFYFDVHPPLGKMLVGLAGAISGFNGSFDYPSGQTYPDHVPFKMMRILMALPGVAMVPLAWGTALELRMSMYGRHLVTLMVLCDIAWIVISRFVLLDSMLLFFTFCTVYCLACFHNEQRRPFDIDWWAWLALTGVSIGCVASVKWVGLFVTALVGLYTVSDLWDKFGDLKMPIRTYIRHWLARIACLIILPFLIYMLCFKIHFLVLDHSGPGDAQMSSLFQAHLRGTDLARSPLDVAFGSKITLKNMGYGGGLLHSHVQTYPVGSQQQQVTCYHYKDSNNDWIVTPRWEDPAIEPEGEIRFLKGGDIVRLVHAATGRNLHSHAVAAPVSKLNNEVSAYGNATVGDANDYWIIEIVDDMLKGKPKNVKGVHSLTTRLRVKHLNTGCYLRAANAILPQWGFKQVEVSCDKSDNRRDEHTYWNIESHWNDRLPEGTTKLYRSPFLRDFWHLNVAMMTSNNALVPDPDKEDSIASSPFEWPFLWTGMRMNGWHDSSIKYYLVGNPIVWWGSSYSLLVAVGATVWYLCRFQRKYNDFAPGQWAHFQYVLLLGVGGWGLHYLPFMIMGRVTYIHHYLPTLWFAVITFGFLLDHFVFTKRRLSDKTKTAVFTIVAGSIVLTYFLFKDCAMGMDGPVNDHKWLKWRSSWNIYND